MDNVIKLPTSLYDMPTSYQLTLHKVRLDKYYKQIGTTFQDELSLAKQGIGSCRHMTNLIQTYDLENLEYFLDIFYRKKVG